jgi:hypothetical protein
MSAPTRSPAADRARLVEIVKSRSFQSGKEVKLASGRSSAFYFNMKPTMMDGEGGYLIASLVLDVLEDEGIRWIGGLEMGAVPIASAVAALILNGRNAITGVSEFGSTCRGAQPGSRAAHVGVFRAQAGQGSWHPQPDRGLGTGRSAEG